MSSRSWGAACCDDEDDNMYLGWSEAKKESKEQDGHSQDEDKEEDPEGDELELNEHNNSCCPSCGQNIQYLSGGARPIF